MAVLVATKRPQALCMQVVLQKRAHGVVAKGRAQRTGGREEE